MLRIYLSEMKTYYLQKYFHMNVHGGFIHNNPKLERAWVFIHKRMNSMVWISRTGKTNLWWEKIKTVVSSGVCKQDWIRKAYEGPFCNDGNIPPR